MIEHASSAERKVQLQLQLEASDGLKDLVGELITPERNREFAQHIFRFVLYTKYPIEIGVDPLNVTSVDNQAQQTMRDYTSTIESRGHMYNRSLHLAPEIGAYEYPDKNDGMNLRFKLALPEIEANKLLAPPFEQVSANSAYIVSHLPNHLLRPFEDRHVALRRMRRRMGISAHQSNPGMTAPDVYYVNHPMIQKRVTSNR